MPTPQVPHRARDRRPALLQRGVRRGLRQRSRRQAEPQLRPPGRLPGRDPGSRRRRGRHHRRGPPGPARTHPRTGRPLVGRVVRGLRPAHPATGRERLQAGLRLRLLPPAERHLQPAGGPGPGRLPAARPGRGGPARRHGRPRVLPPRRDQADELPEDAVGGSTSLRTRRTATLLTVFVVLYVLHVGVEAGVGGWEPTHLEAVGYTTTLAASATSVYWLMLTLGRFLVAPLTLRWSEPAVIAVSCAGMALCLLAAVLPGPAPYAYAGVGLFIAPIFPTGLPWLRRAVPAARRAGALVIAASMVGGVAAGPALGKSIELFDVRTVPAVLFVLAAACLAATCRLTRATRSPLEPARDPAHHSPDTRSALSTPRRPCPTETPHRRPHRTPPPPRRGRTRQRAMDRSTSLTRLRSSSSQARCFSPAGRLAAKTADGLGAPLRSQIGWTLGPVLPRRITPRLPGLSRRPSPAGPIRAGGHRGSRSTEGRRRSSFRPGRRGPRP